MPVPDYESIMQPMLTFLQDGRPQRNSEIIDRLISYFDLTTEEAAETLNSGQRKLGNGLVIVW